MPHFMLQWFIQEFKDCDIKVDLKIPTHQIKQPKKSPKTTTHRVLQFNTSQQKISKNC